jgi:hypothetical protein
VLRTWNGGKGEGTSASHLEQELLRNLDRFVGSVGKGVSRKATGTSGVRVTNVTRDLGQRYRKAVN